MELHAVGPGWHYCVYYVGQSRLGPEMMAGPARDPGVQPQTSDYQIIRFDIPNLEIGTPDPTDSSPGYPKWVG